MEAAPLRSMLKFPSDYRRSRPVLSLIQTLASKYLKSIIGRLVEVTNGGFVALQSQNLASAEWQLWRSASGKNGSGGADQKIKKCIFRVSAVIEGGIDVQW